MNCVLCEKPIKDYSPVFNQLQIDERRSVDVCKDCTEKFLRWQGEKLAALFPSKTMKRMYGKE